MRTLTLASLLTLAACQSSSIADIPTEQVEGYRRGYHQGPEVFHVPDAGSARFAPTLLEGFDAEAAMGTVAALDPFYREAGNEGFDAALDLVLGVLRANGFGEDEGFELRIDERALGHPAWTPRSARLSLVRADGLARDLHAFDASSDRDRCMLPAHAPSADVRGPLQTSLAQLRAGEVLVTEQRLADVLDQAQERGAAAVLSSFLRPFNEDPTGNQRHLDAIRYGRVPPGTTLPVAHISPRVYKRLAAARGATVHLVAEVALSERPLRTVIATVVGDDRAGEVVALVAHVQEPGANDNATGVAGLLEGARALRVALADGTLKRPRRSVAFIWGEEYRASEIFLETTTRRPIAGIAADMLGASKEKTGAICLLERGPDPGALTTLPPDQHTPWGASRVDPETLFPNGLAAILRCALVDVGLAAKGWQTDEHPWEGGSDHDVFLRAGVPGALVWHFTDFAYHTSLDRLEMVDPAELEKASVAVIAGALAVADAGPRDLKRFVETSLAEAETRTGAVELEGAPEEVAFQWVEWHHGSRRWIAALCAGEPLPDRYRID